MPAARRNWQRLDPLAYYREHFEGVTRSELFRRDAGLYQALRVRHLLLAVPTKREAGKPAVGTDPGCGEKPLSTPTVREIDRLHRRCLRDPTKAPDLLRALEHAEGNDSISHYLWEYWFASWDDPIRVSLLRTLFSHVRELTRKRSTPVPTHWETIAWIHSAVTERELDGVWKWAEQQNLGDLRTDMEGCAIDTLREWTGEDSAL